jgi:hypothetical protein
VLLAIWAVPMIMMAMGAPVAGTTTRFILAVMSSPQIIFGFLSRTQNLGILLVVVAGLHFLLWYGKPFQRFWHRRLTFVGLK